MTKQQLLKEAHILSDRFQERSTWKDASLSEDEKRVWYLILAFIAYVEKRL